MKSMESTLTSPANGSGQNSIDSVDVEFRIFTGISVAVTLAALYLCITQLIFCIMKAAKYKKQHRHCGGANSVEHGTILNVMSAVGALGALLRVGVDFRLIYGRGSDFGCDLTSKFKIASYALTFTSIYLVLWLRQRVFYAHSRLRHLSSKLIRFVSWTMLIGVILAIVGASTMFLAQGLYFGTPYGCAIPTGPLVIVQWIFVMTCTAIFQTCLLALFMYPLVKHRMASKKTKASRNSQSTIISLLKRATVTSLACVLSDVCFAFLVIGMQRKTMAFETFCYDLNAVFNAFCMVMSFGNWRTRLMPWLVRRGEVDIERDLNTWHDDRPTVTS